MRSDLRRLRATRGNARSEGGVLIDHGIVKSNSRSFFFFRAISRSAGYRGFAQKRSLVFGFADSILPASLIGIPVGLDLSSSGSEWDSKAWAGIEDPVVVVLASPDRLRPKPNTDRRNRFRTLSSDSREQLSRDQWRNS